jgi:BirA family biotin operon repressor/biotin-[acetyl-CoA-carboxylase] ligase
MDAARDLEAQGLWPVFASLTARSQTAGRGSHGRRWVSPPGHVYAALRLPAAAPFDGSQGSLALAMFMAWALEDLFGLAIAVKWPNDLLLDGRKAGGLLLSSRNGVIDAGVGLNLGAAPVDLERDPWAPPAGALPSSLGPPESLWAKVAENIQMRYNRQFAAAPPDWPARLAAQAEARLAGLGRTVEILAPSTAPPVLPRPGAADEPLRGRLVGLAPSGALKIDGPSGLTTVWSGTLRLKPAPSDA